MSTPKPIKTFAIHPTEEETPFDRQELISWWSQTVLSKARVMVVGAGAIGNETLKNLALLGFGNLLIVDFDLVSTSNLSRTVLFRRDDIGHKKAEVAARRIRELALVDNPHIDWLHGDAVWDLGTGIFRRMDIVLGCLDNVETRFAINRRCWLANKPWIDAGINELAASISVFVPPTSACYQCMASQEQLIAQRMRYSCDDFKRSQYSEGKVPTVQIASAIASALQVQEAVKFLCGQSVAAGKRIYYQGKCNDFDVLGYKRNASCPAHVSYPSVVPLPISFKSTLRDFLTIASHPEFSGPNATLDFRGGGISFIVSAGCRSCGTILPFMRPAFRILDSEVYCEACRVGRRSDETLTPQPATKLTLGQFSLDSTPPILLDMPLSGLGIPALDILAVYDVGGQYMYYELTTDQSEVLPAIFGPPA